MFETTLNIGYYIQRNCLYEIEGVDLIYKIIFKTGIFWIDTRDIVHNYSEDNNNMNLLLSFGVII